MATLSAWFAHNSCSPQWLRHWSVAITRIICLMLRGHFATFTRQPSGTTAFGSMSCRLARPSVSRALPPGRTMPRQGPERRGGRGADVLPPTPPFTTDPTSRPRLTRSPAVLETTRLSSFVGGKASFRKSVRGFPRRTMLKSLRKHRILSEKWIHFSVRCCSWLRPTILCDCRQSLAARRGPRVVVGRWSRRVRSQPRRMTSRILRSGTQRRPRLAFSCQPLSSTLAFQAAWQRT